MNTDKTANKRLRRCCENGAKARNRESPFRKVFAPRKNLKVSSTDKTVMTAVCSSSFIGDHL
jgi:hypothetical protein